MNEITALPELRKLLTVEGCIVTIDAMGCQKEIAAQIREQNGEYLLALKDNHPKLHDEVVRLFAWAKAGKEAAQEVGLDTVVQGSAGHGRVEVRRCWTLGDADLRFLDEADALL